MGSKLSASASVIMNVGVARVWEVMTNPKIMKEYFEGAVTKTNWQVGSEIITDYKWDGIKYRDRGVIQENIFHNKISYTYWNPNWELKDIPKNYGLLTYEFTPIDLTHTEFRWTQAGYPKYWHDLEKDRIGEFLEGIKSIAEKKKQKLKKK